MLIKPAEARSQEQQSNIIHESPEFSGKFGLGPQKQARFFWGVFGFFFKLFKKSLTLKTMLICGSGMGHFLNSNKQLS